MTLVDVNIRLINRPTGKDLLLAGLVSEYGLVMPLLRYFEDIEDEYSIGTQKQARHAFKLFYLFTEATAPDGFGGSDRHGREHAQHFRRFRAAIVKGTVNEKTLEDASQLRWPPGRVSKANRVIWYLTKFFEWADKHGANDAQRFNPTVPPSPAHVLVARAAYEHRRSRAFLGHTWETADSVAVEGRHTGPLREARGSEKPTKRFPNAHFEKLLWQGFTTRSLSNLRDILITILLDKGGLRISEPMHLWMTDVIEDPETGMAKVVIPHPSDGDAPASWATKFGTRARCLEAVFRRKARNEMGPGDPEHAGWKSECAEIQVLWCEPIWGHHFWLLWEVYRRRVQEVVPTALRDHPYAFMAFREPTRGRPLTIAAFRDAHKKAVNRAGLVPSEGSVSLKKLGLTEHGHRHAYGNRAKNEAELKRDVVRDMMNHASPESQDVYTRRTWAEKMDALMKGTRKLHNHSDHMDALLRSLAGPGRWRA